MRWLVPLLVVPILTAADADFFEKKVRPIFVAQCYACHSAKSKIAQGGLRLDVREAAFKGGASGVAIVPGDPTASRLIKAVKHEAQPNMPPWGKIPAEQIQVLEEWVRDGAIWPAEAAPRPTAASKAEARAAAEKHWAWQPVKRVPPPTGSGDPIDRFLAAARSAKGLSANHPADPAALLRRVYFDLTGLPPSESALREFLSDPSPARYAQKVDELLASPAFGERWGRFWLDITYYADTMDPNAGIPAANAWRYRDYVIRSFNADKPVNRFIVEQLAGDLMPVASGPERNEPVTATGYLALGPWTLVQADKEQLKMDVVDAQIDGIGKGLLGLTLGCARCHDHKFDPVSQREYYGLAGILASTRTLYGKWREAGVFSDINQTKLWESPDESAARVARAATYERALADVLRRIDQLEAEKKDEKDPERQKDLESRLTALRKRQGLLDFNQPRTPMAYAVQDEDRPADCRVNIRGNAHQLGDTAPRTFVRVAMFGNSTPPLKGSGRLELARWIADDRNPLTPRVYVNRVWQNIFGAGIVRSADNFGVRGELPSHPELLDHLAAEFMAGGWSTKKLVRRLVLTDAYRMSSEPNKAALEADPENRLLWRMNRRRLEAETIRDAVLSATGQLDETVGGPTLPTDSLTTFSPDLGKVNPPRMVTNGRLPERLRHRRTVHLPVYRPAQMDDLDVMNLFDFANAAQVNATRRETVVPSQALYLMNSEWIREQARVFARTLLDDPAATDPQRIERALVRIYNRLPKPDESTRALDFIYDIEQRAPKGSVKLEKSSSPTEEAWTIYIHTLLASNEFLFRS